MLMYLTLRKVYCISCFPLLRGRPSFRPDTEARQSGAFDWPMSWQWNSSKILSAFPILLPLNHRISHRITAKRDIMYSEWKEYWADWTHRDTEEETSKLLGEHSFHFLRFIFGGLINFSYLWLKQVFSGRQSPDKIHWSKACLQSFTTEKSEMKCHLRSAMGSEAAACEIYWKL